MATNDAPKDTARDAAFVVACVQMRSSRDPAANRDAAINGIRERLTPGPFISRRRR